MDWNNLLFLVFPYVSIVLAVLVTVYRAIYRPFTISSLSSQLLERRKLFWGSLPFHYGIVLILLGHLLALFFPRSLVWWNAVPVRLYLLELTGLALGLWCLGGLLVLLWRRLVSKRVRVVTSPMDVVVLLLLLVSVVTGVLTAGVYRFGSTWFTGVFTPYLWSLLTLRPQPELVAPLPWIIQLHAFNFFILLAVFPFSRLVHVITYPLGYLVRPWQIVVRTGRGTPSGEVQGFER
jgi:nitrate reductase gamma subunit